jgi:putative ABC transport system permease protein
MKINELLSMAFSNLWRRKLRTSLTVLAVVIGATLISLVVSLGSGLQSFVVGQFGLNFPDTAIIVSSGQELSGFGGGGPQEIKTMETIVVNPFTPNDVTALQAIPGVERVDYLVNVSARYIQPETSGKIYTVSVSGVAGYEAAIRPLFQGDTFKDGDTGVALIAYNYLEAFGWPDDGSAVGRTITINVGTQNAYTLESRDYTFTVAGVIDKQVSSAEVLIPQADAIEMARYYQGNPQRYSEAQPGFFLQLKADTAEQVPAIAQAVKDMGFSATTPEDILAQINSVFGVIQVGLSAFGVIALIVAAIGIINTLLMAIHERTREIGVMKAVGATRGNIRWLFTTEGATLGFLGGAIGGGLALLAGQALNFIGARTFLSDFPGFELTAFPVWLIPGVILLTTAVSLLAGLYPAGRAARLDPVEALRYE